MLYLKHSSNNIKYMKVKQHNNRFSFVGTVAQFKEFLKEVEYQATAPKFGHNYEEWDEYE